MKVICFVIILFTQYFLFSQSNHYDSIIQERKVKESELLDISKGLLNSEDLQHFESLHYFFVDSTYIIKANFEKAIGKKFEMATSTERKPIYRIYGYLFFKLNEAEQKLTVYQNMSLKKDKKYKNYFFVPFRDMTSGAMTYGGGRYLDLTILKNQNTILIDFNRAYNPYCAYSHRYSCPIAPQENTLELFLYSGEKNPIYKETK
jgi:uncharacterized protein (DUF1684 family)